MAKKEDLGFEGAMKKLEDIVERMEAGSLGLDELVAKFEEGQSLIKLCSAKLNDIERRIEVLIKKDTGPEVVDFERDGEVAEDSGVSDGGAEELF